MHNGAAIATIIADAFGRMHAKFSNRIFLPFTLILISYAGINAIIPSEPKYWFVLEFKSALLIHRWYYYLHSAVSLLQQSRYQHIRRIVDTTNIIIMPCQDSYKDDIE